MDLINQEALKEIVRQIVKEELAKSKVEEAEIPKSLPGTPPLGAPPPPATANPVLPTPPAAAAQNQPPDMPIG